jgi:hypothetical protein
MYSGYNGWMGTMVGRVQWLDWYMLEWLGVRNGQTPVPVPQSQEGGGPVTGTHGGYSSKYRGLIETQVGVRTSQTPVPVIRSTMNVAQKWAL